MTHRYEVPASVTELAQLLEPLETCLRNSVWIEPPNSENPPLSRAQVRRHFQGIRTFAGKVVRLLNEEIAPLTVREPPNTIRMKKAVTKLSILVTAQVQQYHALLSSRDASGEELNALLGEAYRHNLLELRNWMADLINISREPASFLAPDRPPKITLVLEFTACPALKSLRDHLITPSAPSKHSTQQRPTPSLWSQLCWILMGIGLVHWLFESDDA